MRTRLRLRASCPNKPQNKNPAFRQSESGRSACRKSSRAAGAHSNRKQRWNRCFHKIRGHVPRILYQSGQEFRKSKLLSRLDVSERMLSTSHSIETVVSIEKLSIIFALPPRHVSPRGIYWIFFSAIPRSRMQRRTCSRSSVYTTETSGIANSMPITPPRLAPSVTATSTQMDGRPTEPPTTRG